MTFTIPLLCPPWIYGSWEASETPLLAECTVAHSQVIQSQVPL